MDLHDVASLVQGLALLVVAYAFYRHAKDHH